MLVVDVISCVCVCGVGCRVLFDACVLRAWCLLLVACVVALGCVADRRMLCVGVCA